MEGKTPYSQPRKLISILQTAEAGLGTGGSAGRKDEVRGAQLLSSGEGLSRQTECVWRCGYSQRTRHARLAAPPLN